MLQPEFSLQQVRPHIPCLSTSEHAKGPIVSLAWWTIPVTLDVLRLSYGSLSFTKTLKGR
ncbi:hypothetical protein An07g01880 [Aspergillus niger]|uniref:Uncharacterized protein n=2 Tax=Aspergillus niger TaxID=5061 RepID=A2QMF2_ASPNC|nr:hypothetical protein An07g01880 [Aspergillus niger]CAK48090.1 hypothetical protein An07g01880 [Aspergillus niger]